MNQKMVKLKVSKKSTSSFMSFYACMKNKPVIEVFKLILNTTDSKAERSFVGVHVGSGTGEDQVTRVQTTHRATPIVPGHADSTDIANSVMALTRHRPFERGSKSTHRCIYTPT